MGRVPKPQKCTLFCFGCDGALWRCSNVCMLTWTHVGTLWRKVLRHVCIKHSERSWQKILIDFAEFRNDFGVFWIQTKVLIWHCRHPHGLFSMFSLALGHAETCEKQGLGLIVDWTLGLCAQCGLLDCLMFSLYLMYLMYLLFTFIYHVFAVCLQFHSLQFLSRCQLVLPIFQLVFSLHIRVLGCLMRTSTELLYRGPQGEPNVWSAFFMQPAEMQMTSKVMIDSEMVRDVERCREMSASKCLKVIQSHRKSYKVHVCLPSFARQSVMQSALDSNLPKMLGHFRKMHPDVATGFYLRLRYMETSKHHVVYGHYRGVIQAKHGGSETMWQTQIIMILLHWSSCKRILNSGMMFHQIRKDQAE